MVEDVAEQVDPWTMLSRLGQQVCATCGQESNLFASACESCGAAWDHAEEVSLDVLAEAEPRPRPIEKVSMDEATNLDKLIAARDGLARGGSVELFAESVDEVLYVVESGLDLYGSPAFKKELSRMPIDAARVYSKLAAAAGEMQRGLYRMLSFLNNSDLAEVDAGLAQVESALWKVDDAQELALQKRAA